jgi:hypothetical protein
MKGRKIAYWIATGLLSALLLFSAVSYFLKYETIREVFAALGFPAWIIRPLAVAKVLGVAAIVSRKSETLKEWAYAGICFDLLLAIGAHLSVGDGKFLPALACLVFLAVSYLLDRRLHPRTTVATS